MLLSKILLTDLGKEPERQAHTFCRYANDSNICVKSKTAGKRVSFACAARRVLKQPRSCGFSRAARNGWKARFKKCVGGKTLSLPATGSMLLAIIEVHSLIVLPLPPE